MVADKKNIMAKTDGNRRDRELGESSIPLRLFGLRFGLWFA